MTVCRTLLFFNIVKKEQMKKNKKKKQVEKGKNKKARQHEAKLIVTK
jgi:hypothetical protein